MNDLLQVPLVMFAFVFLIPLVLLAGGLVSFFAVGALFDALDNPEALQKKIEAAFRRPPREPQDPGHKHYYRPYWKKAA